MEEGENIRFLPLPCGRRPLQIIGVEVGKSPKGSDRITIIFSGIGSEAQMRVCEDFYLSDESLWKLSELCVAVRLRAAVPIRDQSRLAEIFVGRTLTGEVYDHTWTHPATREKRTQRRVRHFKTEDIHP